MGKKPIVSVTYENERISIKKTSYLNYLKCVLRLSCVVHGPICGRFVDFYVNGFSFWCENKATVVPADRVTLHPGT